MRQRVGWVARVHMHFEVLRGCGTLAGFGGWAGKFSALTSSSTKTTVTTSFIDRVGLGDWLAAKSNEGKITGTRSLERIF